MRRGLDIGEEVHEHDRADGDERHEGEHNKSDKNTREEECAVVQRVAHATADGVLDGDVRLAPWVRSRQTSRSTWSGWRACRH